MSVHCRDIHTLPLSRTIIEKLVQNGFRTVNDLQITPLELARECNISHEIALNIIQTAETSIRSSSQSSNINKVDLTAKDLLLKIGSSSNQRSIITFCKAIDQMLGGGVSIGQITEFCGVPGVGKTQIAMQLSLTVQIPFVFGGLGSECIYIDTEGSFMVERVHEMASEISARLNKLANRNPQGMHLNRNASEDAAWKSQESMLHLISAAQDMTPERFLEGIHVFRVHDQSELIATITHLEAFLKVRTKVRLIVIDSIAFHFRQELSDHSIRSRCLSNIAQTLNQLGYEHNLATVVVNHVTTRFERPVAAVLDGVSHAITNSSHAAQRLVPALGEQWSHCVTNRVMLYWHQGKQRMASLVKCPSMPCIAVKYCVCEKGIRDADTDKKRKVNQQFSADAPSQDSIARMNHNAISTSDTVRESGSHNYEHHDYHIQQQQRQKYQQAILQQQQQQYNKQSRTSY